MSFTVRDSGARQQFASGMERDTTEGKIEYWRMLDGPMFDRWAQHLEKGAVKYPDTAPGISNWTLAAGSEEHARFKASAFRHFLQWYRGETDEDHAAAVFFNINGAEYAAARGVATMTATPAYQGCSYRHPGTDIPCAFPDGHLGSHRCT